MIYEKAQKAVSRMMSIGCFFKIFPYGWDPINYRLTRAGRLHMFLYRVHEFWVVLTFSFMSFRLVQTLRDDVPPRIRIMNVIWVLAYSLVLACNYQFDRKCEEIMFFTNSLFEDRERIRREALKKIDKNSKDMTSKVDWVSILVLTSSFLLITNPPAHATVLISSPCAPQYISSLVFECESAGDKPVHWLHTIPFVILENLIISDMMFIWTFNWVIVFLGMNWITEIMSSSRKCNIVGEYVDTGRECEVHRKAQLLVVILNDAFFFYLQYFPSILFTIAAMLLFATIRYTDIDFHSYVVFPFCGLRCLFEATTAIAAAGIVNQESFDYLTNWDRRIQFLKSQGERKDNSIFRKSCWRLNCSAGGMYTFENSIVLVSLDNCSQLTFNMLVTYDN